MQLISWQLLSEMSKRFFLPFNISCSSFLILMTHPFHNSPEQWNKLVRFPHLPPTRSGINKILHSPGGFLMSYLIDLKVVNNIEENIKEAPSWNALHRNISENKISFLQINIKHDFDRRWTRYHFVYFTWNASRRPCLWQLKPQLKHPINNCQSLQKVLQWYCKVYR